MKCPACKNSLVVVERDGIEVDWCPECHGIWFDVGELAMLAQKAGREIDPGTIGEPVRHPREKPRRCPRCRRKMQKVAVADDDNLRLDRCPRHGLWFDAGELGRLMRGLASKDTGTGAVVGFLNETFTPDKEASA